MEKLLKALETWHKIDTNSGRNVDREVYRAALAELDDAFDEYQLNTQAEKVERELQITSYDGEVICPHCEASYHQVPILIETTDVICPFCYEHFEIQKIVSVKYATWKPKGRKYDG